IGRVNRAGQLGYEAVRKSCRRTARPCRHRAAPSVLALNHNVRTHDADLKRQSRTGINDRADFPIAENGVAHRSEVVLLAFSEWQLIERAQVESVTHVKIVVAVVVIKLTLSTRIVGGGASFVRARSVTEGSRERVL